MEYIKKSKNYQHLFHFNGFGLLTNDIWVRGYRDLDALITSSQGDCYYWLPQKSVRKALREGAKLFSDPALFQKHKKEFENLLVSLEKDYRKTILNASLINQLDAKNFLENLSKAFFYFRRTEYFFVDEAFKLSGDNVNLKKNLEINYKLKEKARVKWLNDVHLEDNAYLKVFCAKLAKQFKVRYDDLFEYTTQEILSLYQGKTVPSAKIARRKLAKVIFSLDGKIVIYSGQRINASIQRLVKEKVHSKLPQGNILKGIPVSRGKITGRVKVIISDGDTFSLLGSEFRKMKKGDILVAETTSPEFMPACRKASAILANQGGLLSHAAVVSREFGIPAVVGLKIATQVLKDGDLVEVDGTTGIVRILK